MKHRQAIDGVERMWSEDREEIDEIRTEFDSLLEDDEISEEEEGFLQGYYDDEENDYKEESSIEE